MRKLTRIVPFSSVVSIFNHKTISLTRKYWLVCNYEVMLPTAVHHSQQVPTPAIIYSLLFFHEKYTVIRYWSHSRCDELNKMPPNVFICCAQPRLACIYHGVKLQLQEGSFGRFQFFTHRHCHEHAHTRQTHGINYIRLSNDLSGSLDAYPPTILFAVSWFPDWSHAGQVKVSSCVCPLPRGPPTPIPPTIVHHTSAHELTPGFSQLHAVRQNVSSLGVANRKEGRHLRVHHNCVCCFYFNIYLRLKVFVDRIFSIQNLAFFLTNQKTKPKKENSTVCLSFSW